MGRRLVTWMASAAVVAGAWGRAGSAALDEFTVKRESVFEFAGKPTITRRGDRIEIRFETKAFCDVTVAIEETGRGSEKGGGDLDGRVPDPFFRPRIIRHLASGVLGPNAPEPFRKNSKAQVLIWDGKDDQGEYVDDKERVAVRVSLGLNPRFERTLFWSPKRRSSQEALPMAAAPEGVYVFDGRVLDHVRLFDHDGNYLRTVYPFAADKLARVEGLHWRELPQDGRRQPMREGFHQSTLLSSGTNAGFDEQWGFGADRHNNWHGSVWGNAASFMAVSGSRLALGRLLLNRLATDGTTGGLPLTGPTVAFPTVLPGGKRGTNDVEVEPRSAAFSPDGRFLYLAGYVQGHGQAASRDIILINHYEWLPGVVRVDFAAGQKAEVFLGAMQSARAGTDNARFRTPSSVAVDAQGRVYVADTINNRVQVFSPDGQFLKTIPVDLPAKVAIHAKTQEIYVFSWPVPHLFGEKPDGPDAARYGVRRRKPDADFDPALTVFKSFDDPKSVLACPLPFGGIVGRGTGLSHQVVLDSYVDPPRVWITSDWGRLDIMTRGKIQHTNVRVYALEGGALKLKRDFDADVRKEVVRTEVAEYWRQRLYVNPLTGDLFVGEGEAATGKSFKQLVKVSPETAKVQLVDLPFDAEDLAFGADGLAYLRTFYQVARYDPGTWKEVPFDYGLAKDKVSTSTSSDRRTAFVASAIQLPVAVAGLHHHGGMCVSVKGNLVIAVNNHTETITRRDVYDEVPQEVGHYTPTIFPGRVRWGEVHVYDRHGRVLYEDAVPGLNRADGLGMDKDDNLYILSTAVRNFDGKPYFNFMRGTLIKVKAKAAKVLSGSDRAEAALPAGMTPERPPDLVSGHLGRAWVEGAQWFYGGLGFSGKNYPGTGGCDCYNARFALDYFARSFAPETDHYSVAVLDSNGNLILRVGRYGNVDDGVPLIKTGGPAEPRPMGGDEVSLFYAPYVATHTDHRLFIADPGNSRLVSVRLDYHATERVPLKDVPEGV